MGTNDSGQAVQSGDLLELFRKLCGLRLCIGNRWKCDNGHEWVTTHCDAAWFAMPTTCPECGKTATAHRGEWATLNDRFSNAAHDGRRKDTP